LVTSPGGATGMWGLVGKGEWEGVGHVAVVGWGWGWWVP
jgi:hypothetical protein